MNAAVDCDPILAEDDERSRIERIADLINHHESWSLVLTGPGGARLEVPGALQDVFQRLVRVLARGDAVSVVPYQKDLTTQQAAELLNVSRQYLVRLLDRGDIPCYRVGTHRRVVLADVLSYRRQRDRERRRGLNDLTRLSQELGLYDA